MPFSWSRKHTIAAVTAGALAVAGVGIAVALRSSGPEPTVAPPAASAPTTPPSPARPSPKTTPAPAEEARPVDPLTGGSPSKNGVIAVKVENIAAALPQVGLRAADIVFAEEVEGSQTRLIAVYHTSFPSRLGPVRSARSTDVQLLPLFGRPGLVYSGANRNVQARIGRASIVPIERSTRDNRRVAPHNVFVDLRAIAGQVKTKKATSIGWTFAEQDSRWAGAPKDDEAAGRVGADRFSFDFRDGRYVVRWRGQPYRDEDSGKLATTDNVVVMSVNNRGDGNADVNGARSVLSETVGRGRVRIYRDGRTLSGTWQRKSEGADLSLLDEDGKDLPLAPGKTWVLLAG